MSSAYQTSFFDEGISERPINVASVPQLSPFRYPGGKTWFIPRLLRWISSLQCPIRHFIEPFAGGGIASLIVADLKLAERVTMVEKDPAVAAVWQTILYGDYQWLIDQIIEFDMNLENLQIRLATDPETTEEIAFQTILRNRTYHGGILAPGSGLIKAGENGKGISSRWYANTLRKRILRIRDFSDRINFVHGDAFEVMAAEAHDETAAFFIDPPYTAAGKKAGQRLYNFHEVDHDQMFSLLSTAKANILMTYDLDEEIMHMASRHSFSYETISMNNTHHATMSELVISNRRMPHSCRLIA